MAISFKSLGSSSKIQKTEIIKSTQSWTAPADVSKVEVILCGGGGSGLGQAGTNGVGSGGSGSVVYSVLTVTPNTSYTITIGAGGSAVQGYTGNDGSSSSFGGLLSVSGGGKAINPWAYSANTMSSASELGGSGGTAYYTGSTWTGGTGGAGSFGYGGGGGAGGYSGAGNGSTGGGSGSWGSNSTASSASANSGAGGGSAGNSSSAYTTGGNGGSGICVIKYWSAL